jgi:hypothetical protein
MKIKPSNEALLLSHKILSDIEKLIDPPEEGFAAESNQVVLFSIVKGTRGYIERVSNQINGCYEKGWFDSCAVMIRRLLETLIIECFEKYQISDKIKNIQDEFLYLKDLIDKTLLEKSWNLGRNTKKALPKLKDIGDKSAHSRRFNAQLNDIKDLIPEIRLVVQELVYLAQLK